VTITSLFDIPASWSKKKAATTVFCTKKPDCDNIAKIVLDALNGIAFHDDSQVSCLTVHKHYVAASTGGPRTIVMIDPI
jgi:Holliday junction resolvase RusA-like endonuclease